MSGAPAVHSVSPTQLEILRTCQLRFAYDHSPIHRARTFRGPSARLGLICHQILEQAGRGDFDETTSLSDTFENQWEEFVVNQEKEAANLEAEQHLANRRFWPGYSVKKALLQQQVTKLVTDRKGVKPYKGTGFFLSKPIRGTEQRLSGFGGRIVGRADRIVDGPLGIEINDYKTGQILEAVDTAETETLRETHRRQLLLYAALVYDEIGKWPTVARVIPLSGQPIEIAVEPAEALAEANDALHLLSMYNVAAASQDPQTLANPSSEHCHWCPYKGFCDPYWKAVNPDWNTPSSIEGVLDTYTKGINGASLKLTIRAGTLQTGTYSLSNATEARFPGIAEQRPGTSIRIIAFKTVPERMALIATTSTEIWWP